ncbi:MAG: RES family NAD+ phosphorylase [bacterium]|jgi:RES domain-containing protein|nr:RES family NAD+ phosphorylase [bacterium]
MTSQPKFQAARPDADKALRGRILACLPHAMAFDGVGFRSVGMKYATEGDLLSGHGASCYGGRWNPPGMRAVYVSLSPVTAVKEAYQLFLRNGISAAQIRPRVLAGLHLRVQRLLDLTDTSVRRRVGFRLRDLLEEWAAIQHQGGEAGTQSVGRCAFELGFEGLLAPSVQDPHGSNLVVFPERLLPGSELLVMAAGDLPPHPLAC